MRKAVINTETGLVENIIVADDDFDPGPNKELRDPTDAEIGGTWDGSKYLPKPPIPEKPSPIKSAIASANTLEDLKTALITHLQGV